MAKSKKSKVDPVPALIGEAAQAIEEEKPDLALKNLNKIHSHASVKDFRDYDLFLTAEAYREIGERLSSDKAKSPEALANLERSYLKLIDLYSRFPASPLLERLTDRLSRVDFYRGKIKASSQDTERAFARVFGLKSPLSRIPFDTLDPYVKACVVNPNPMCTGWIRKSVEGLPKRAPERASLEKNIPSEFLDRDRTESFERLTQTYREEILSDVAEIEETMTLLLKGRDTDALDHFEEFIKRYPKSVYRARAQYWLGALYKKKGRQKDAEDTWKAVQTESPFSYYSLLIHWTQKTDPLANLPKPSGEPYLSRGTWLKPTEWARVDRAEVFLKAEAKLPASLELIGFPFRTEMPSAFLEYLTSLQHESGNHLQVFQLVSELFQRRADGLANTRTLDWLYPLPDFFAAIEENAKASGIDPLLTLSLIKQESGFENEIVSHAGASGLMQIMPVSALDIDPDVLQIDLKKPMVNLRIGTRYLASILKRFKGNIVLSLSGYNAGPTRADRWKQEADPKWGTAEFIESIPFRETRDYVTSIIRNHYWYSTLNGRTHPASLEFYWNPDRAETTANSNVKPKKHYISIPNDIFLTLDTK